MSTKNYFCELYLTTPAPIERVERISSTSNFCCNYGFFVVFRKKKRIHCSIIGTDLILEPAVRFPSPYF